MQAQKFDPTKPHGTIYGHPSAAFEQNGFLYTADHECLDAPAPPKNKTTPKSPVKNSDQFPGEKEFLQDILAGGPVSRTVIKRESEKKDLVWANVESAAAELRIMKYKEGAFNMWRLTAE